MKMRARWLATFAGSTLLGGLGQAELVDRGTTTLDTETGLEWLDVSATLGVSAYDILVGGYGNYVADGWTLATVEQIDELFLHAGIPLPHDGSQTMAGFAGANLLIGLLGATGSSGSGQFIQGFSGTLVASGPPFLRTTPVVITALGSSGGADLLGAAVPSSVRNATIGNYLVRLAGPSTIEVSIDIKPRSVHNPVQPRSHGVLPVAVLTTDSFDVHDIDLLSVRFGPAGAAPARTKALYLDVDCDGDLDLLLFFRTQATGIACGDTTASLLGATIDGTPLEGHDDILTVGCAHRG